LPLQKVLIKIKGSSILLSSHDVDEKLTFKTIHSNQIKDVFYPDKTRNFIALVYTSDEADLFPHD